MCSLFSVLHFFINLGKHVNTQLMLENFVFLVIFDTCDVVYNWSISLLPPIVLDNLFELHKNICFLKNDINNYHNSCYADAWLDFLYKNLLYRH